MLAYVAQELCADAAAASLAVKEVAPLLHQLHPDVVVHTLESIICTSLCCLVFPFGGVHIGTTLAMSFGELGSLGVGTTITN